MEKSTAIGLVLAVIAIGVGMVLKGASLGALWNPAAYLIIFGGTAAALFVAFPLEEIKVVPKLFKLIFKTPQSVPKKELLEQFVNLAGIARKEGLLGLENSIESIKIDFMKSALQLAIDSPQPEIVREVLIEDISAMEERHRLGALIFTQAGTYAPTLGVLGAVIGLIAALGNLKDMDKLGHSIAAAFIATLLGIFSGYVLWHPIANKLKRISLKEVELKQFIIEGVLSLQSGTTPMEMQQKLLVYLPDKDRKEYLQKVENSKREGKAA